MNITGYLKIKKSARHSREKDKVEWCVKQPTNLKANEVFIKIELQVPDSLFVPVALFAKVEVPHVPSEITAEVKSQMEDAIRAATKVSIKIH